jgi:hypothetical protein
MKIGTEFLEQPANKPLFLSIKTKKVKKYHFFNKKRLTFDFFDYIVVFIK